MGRGADVGWFLFEQRRGACLAKSLITLPQFAAALVGWHRASRL